MDFLYVILGILIFLILFLLIRNVITWYWKLNEIVSLLKKIEKNTRKKDETVEISENKNSSKNTLTNNDDISDLTQGGNC